MASRVFIVEDHPKMRETYTLFISREPDLEICGIAASGAEALALIPDADPAIVIVDLSLPDVDGVDLVRQLRQSYASLPILVVSGYGADQLAGPLIVTGANGFVSKQDAYRTLIPTIRQLLTQTPT